MLKINNISKEDFDLYDKDTLSTLFETLKKINYDKVLQQFDFDVVNSLYNDKINQIKKLQSDLDRMLKENKFSKKLFLKTILKLLLILVASLIIIHLASVNVVISTILISAVMISVVAQKSVNKFKKQKFELGRNIKKNMIFIEKLQSEAIKLLGERKHKEKILRDEDELESYLYALSDVIYKKEHGDRNIMPNVNKSLESSKPEEARFKNASMIACDKDAKEKSLAYKRKKNRRFK